jgi:hypothetical protein
MVAMDVAKRPESMESAFGPGSSRSGEDTCLVYQRRGLEQVESYPRPRGDDVLVVSGASVDGLRG